MLDKAESNTPKLQRVHYILLIKLSLAASPHCVHRAVQVTHSHSLCEEENICCVPVLPQLPARIETS